ncbi:MAG: hypothetical protein JW712_12980 [Dehalococcoidales bacterium]|nr:hypothetical protein [Dehalococcoidales bacterium]
MDSRVIADKLLDLAYRHSHDIAEKWYNSLIVSQRTPSYSALERSRLIQPVKKFLENLKPLYFSKESYILAQNFFENSSYLKYIYDAGIPLEEAVYAYVILRRHLWLFAESQGIFNTSLDMYQGMESINRTILLLDYATDITIKKYREMREEGQS